MSQKSTLIRQITSAMEMELAPIPGESMSLADIERRLGELNDQTRELVAESARAGGCHRLHRPAESCRE